MASESILSQIDNTPFMLRSADYRGMNRIQNESINEIDNIEEESKINSAAIAISRQNRQNETHATMKTASFSNPLVREPHQDTENSAIQIKEVLESEKSETEINVRADLSAVIVTEGDQVFVQQTPKNIVEEISEISQQVDKQMIDYNNVGQEQIMKFENQRKSHILATGRTSEAAPPTGNMRMMESATGDYNMKGHIS